MCQIIIRSIHHPIALFLKRHLSGSALSPRSLRTKIQFQGADFEGAHRKIPEIPCFLFTKEGFFFLGGGLKWASLSNVSCVYGTLHLSPLAKL